MFQAEELIDVDGVRVGPGGLTPGGLEVGEGLLDVSGEAAGLFFDSLYLVLPEAEPLPQVVLAVLLPVHLPVFLKFVHREEHFEVVPHGVLK